VGSYGSHHSTSDFSAECILTVKFASTGYQKEDHLRPSDGLHERRRDIEYGMVPVYEFDDIEYRSLDGTRGMAGHSDGSGYTGVEGVEPFPRGEEQVAVCMSALANGFFCFSGGAG